jgi:hypothetical protein
MLAQFDGMGKYSQKRFLTWDMICDDETQGPQPIQYLKE